MHADADLFGKIQKACATKPRIVAYASEGVLQEPLVLLQDKLVETFI